MNISQLKLRSEKFDDDDDDDDNNNDNNKLFFFCFSFYAFVFPVYLPFIAFIVSNVCNSVS